MTSPAGELAKLAMLAAEIMAERLNVAFPCRVLSFNEQTGLATVQPLLRVTDEDPKPIQNVPALGHKYRVNGGTVQSYRPALQQGDMVYVVCADREIRGTLSGEIATPSRDKMHDINFAVIVGVFPCSLQS